MQVLLMQNVPGIGNAGEVKKVADGYARNFLLPRKLAVVATDGAIKQSDAIKQAVVRREAKTRGEAEELAKLIEKVTLTFQAKAGEGDRLFGSVTSGDIADALAREKGITVDKRKIELPSPLKELGNHPVAIKLHPDVTAKVMVVVERQTA
jgi:large subunit ribosomal protein L9